MVLRPPSVFYGLTLMLMTGMGPVFGLSPMGYYNSLVAGNAEQGFKDGKFYEAQFKQPSGLVVDDSGSRLFVADWANQRVRVVYLREENRVETLAGTGVAGNGDGA
ncbi:MAG TPA: hypothetical protein VJ873_10420, partial [bacterium]|nr:hypothetical protein [bacterium]